MKPPQPKAFEIVTTVDDMIVAAALLQNGGNTHSFGPYTGGKTSDGSSQAPGPIPMLKKDRYSARPKTVTRTKIDEECKTEHEQSTSHATETSRRGRRPFLSKFATYDNED
jgi:hypothetical protein